MQRLRVCSDITIIDLASDRHANLSLGTLAQDRATYEGGALNIWARRCLDTLDISVSDSHVMRPSWQFVTEDVSTRSYEYEEMNVGFRHDTIVMLLMSPVGPSRYTVTATRL
ncbi:hypothetical protein E2C01_068566 [Portunus trituberculatus]|uniref:Uncharacterized protein n=1 Tax=Portunus trituberculatus TaxID=210409 RepID=A0A5B7I0F7_PORTR|nr:hypothetical protein [Portunus trituberculatus]